MIATGSISVDEPPHSRLGTQEPGFLVEQTLLALGEGRIDDAIECIERIGMVAQDDAISLYLTGLASFRLEEPGKALAAFEGAHRAASDIREYAEALSVVYARLGKISDALFYGKLAIAASRAAPYAGLLPDWFGTFKDSFYAMSDESALVRAVKAAERADWPIASELYRKATEIDAHSVVAWRGLADSLLEQERAEDALAALAAISKLCPDDPLDFPRFARAFELRGDWDNASSAAQLAPRADETDAVIAWQPVRIALARPDADRAKAATQMQDWRRRFIPAGAGPRRSIKTVPISKRRMRLGVISSNWREGDGLDLIVPLLAALPRRSIELHVYADGATDSALAHRARAAAGEWHDIHGLDDETAAFLIANDDLDALIDLDGPLRRKRVVLLASRPASLMISWLDLPEAAAGFDAVVIDDAAGADLVGVSTLRLPGVFSLPQPGTSFDAATGRHLAGANPVFGSLAYRREITGRTAGLWSSLLTSIPGARLQLLHQRVEGLEGARQMAPLFSPDLLPRIELSDPATSTPDYLRQLDVLLDPPGGGHPDETVAAASLGIPVVTLPGATPSQRLVGGWLQRHGLTELVAESDARYVSIAQDVCSAPRNSKLREILQTVATSESSEGNLDRARALEAGLRQLIELHEENVDERL